MEIHGYTSNAGITEVRKAVADSLNRRFGTHYTENNIFMTIGAAAALGICFRTLVDGPEDEIITIAPYFPEYQAYAQGAGCKLVTVLADTSDFQINFEKLEEAVNEHTKAVLINSPNNPTGVVYSEETIQNLKCRMCRNIIKIHWWDILSVNPCLFRESVWDILLRRPRRKTSKI